MLAIKLKKSHTLYSLLISTFLYSTTNLTRNGLPNNSTIGFGVVQTWELDPYWDQG